MPTFKRAAIVSIKIANAAKIARLHKMRDISEQIVKEYIDVLWERDYLPEDAYKDLYDSIPNRFEVSARFLQILCQKASGMLRSIRTRARNLRFQLNSAIDELFEDFNDPEFVVSDDRLDFFANRHRLITKLENVKPVIENYSLDLHGNCLKIDLDSQKTKMIKTWITFNASVKRGIERKTLAADDFRRPFSIPFTPTKIFNRWKRAASKSPTAIQFTKEGVMKVIFTVVTKAKTRGKVEGCDIGLTNVWSLSNEECASEVNEVNKKLSDVLGMMFCREKGTTVFRKLQTQRRNFTNCSLNKLRDKLTGIKELHIENIKGMKKTDDIRKHWSAPQILDKIRRLCEEICVKVVEVNPQYTSLRCHKCDWVCEFNRTGKVFLCTKCGHAEDADINAAKNIKRMDNEMKMKGNKTRGFYFHM